MATGAGKTFTAITSIYRLLKFAQAKRVLFLVDTKNLGEQAEQEFMAFLPNDDNRKFTELYSVQRLRSSHIAADSQVCISTIQRLYAIGETSCTGLHGANRLASNSLLEALAYAHQAAQKSMEEMENLAPEPSIQIPPWDDSGTTDSDEVIMVSHTWNEIRMLMWNYVGIVRSDKRLARANRRIEIIQNEINEYYWNFKITPDIIELRNIATVAELIIKCARHRKESRGLHYNLQYPQHDDRWLKDTILRRPFVG